jgi:hypothetical protein
MPATDEMSESQARSIMSAGLGKAELEFATSLAAPLFWVMKKPDKYEVRNGSCFFLDTGEALFGVTANHVLAGLAKDRVKEKILACQIGSDLQFDESRIIDAHEGIDIATFQITRDEIDHMGKVPYIGYQSTWPPAPPEQGKGIFYSGFTGVGTIILDPRQISFGAAPCSGVASSISERDVSSLIERSNLIDVMGKGPMPPNYNFQGISGGPMLTVVEHNGLRLNRLAGIVIQGPSTIAEESIQDFEVVRARRAHFIFPDGRLDRLRCTW